MLSTQEVVTEEVPQHVHIYQDYHNSTFPKVMETNLTWGPSQEFILQFTLVAVSAHGFYRIVMLIWAFNLSQLAVHFAFLFIAEQVSVESYKCHFLLYNRRSLCKCLLCSG